jgi:hypothetical protein
MSDPPDNPQRTDTLVTGPLSTNDVFVLGGLKSTTDGKPNVTFPYSSVPGDPGFSLYCSENTNLVLCRGWNQIYSNSSDGFKNNDPSKTLKPVYFKWELFTDSSNGMRYVLHAYTEPSAVNPLGYIGYDGSWKVTRSLDNSSKFNFFESFYDWNDGTVSLQAWNVYKPVKTNTLTFYTGDSSNIITNPGGFTSKLYEDNTKATFNFIPIPIGWYTFEKQDTNLKQLTVKEAYKNLLSQQCYRFAGTSLFKTSGCLVDASKSRGNVNKNVSISANYNPYHISDVCGESFKSIDAINDTMGKSISVLRAYGQTESGYCVSNANSAAGTNSFSVSQSCAIVSVDACINCTPEICPDACSSFARSPACKTSVCGACNKTNCPIQFSSCDPGSVDLSGMGVVGWIVIFTLAAIVIGLAGYIFWKHSEDNKKEKHQKRKRKETNGR